MGRANVKKTPELYRRDCKLCGCPLGFGVTSSGKEVPLDLRAKVFCPVWEKSDSHEGFRVIETTMAFVSHYETCPKRKVEE